MRPDSLAAFDAALAPREEVFLFDEQLVSSALYDTERPEGGVFRWVGPLPQVAVVTKVSRASPVSVEVYVAVTLNDENISGMTISLNGEDAATRVAPWAGGAAVVTATFPARADAHRHPLSVIEITVPHAARPNATDERMLSVGIHKVVVHER
ncbi:MAG: hypothetical protein AB7E60_07690 [Sphingobium sp.]